MIGPIIPFSICISCSYLGATGIELSAEATRKECEVAQHTKEVHANPHAELSQYGALANAIATAAMEAAGSIAGPTWFKVEDIRIEVKPNPGPTSYRVTITSV